MFKVIDFKSFNISNLKTSIFPSLFSQKNAPFWIFFLSNLMGERWGWNKGPMGLFKPKTSSYWDLKNLNIFFKANIFKVFFTLRMPFLGIGPEGGEALSSHMDVHFVCLSIRPSVCLYICMYMHPYPPDFFLRTDEQAEWMSICDERASLPLGPMPHFNPLITPSTEMGHRDLMTINTFASIEDMNFAIS
jgi:hypothetical protein